MARPVGPERVFVYGTLLTGGRNHHYLQDARRLGPHRTDPRYTLVHLGAFPGVIPGGATAVSGEVYAVDTPILARLDQLEDYPRVYTRRRIPTPWGPAWIYLYRHPRPGQRVIPDGVWRV